MIKFILIFAQLFLPQIVHGLSLRSVLANEADGVLTGVALVASLLLIAQLTSLLIVPSHAVAHAQAAHAPDAPAAASSSSSALSVRPENARQRPERLTHELPALQVSHQAQCRHD